MANKRPNDKIDFDKYQVDSKLILPKRVAHLLNWTAINYPKVYLQWNRIYQVITGISKLPSIKSEDVLRLRSKSQDTKKYLWATYNRGVAHHRLLGIRATVDDDDKLENEGKKAITRLNSAGQRVIEVTKSIDINELNAENRTFFTKHLNPLAKAISTVQFAAMLEVPKEDKP